MPDPTVWTVPANGGEIIAEEYGYLTDVMTAFNGAEQRMRLRVIPLRTVEFAFVAKGREARLAQSLLHSIQDEIAVVPQWQFGSPLTAQVNPGATLLPITDALDVLYKNGQYALVHQDAFSWELFLVSSHSGSGVSAAADPAVGTWPAGTLVYPARLARLQDRARIRWSSSDVLEGPLLWTMEQL